MITLTSYKVNITVWGSESVTTIVTSVSLRGKYVEMDVIVAI